MMKQLHVWVTGRVQGVWFRESTRQFAESAGLTGWVRNLADGRVEAVFTGERADCEKALAYVRKGPQAASVESVEHRWESPDENPSPIFEVLR